MLCPVCRQETPDGKPFCGNCGNALSPTCARCGAELVASLAFCVECGAKTTVAELQLEQTQPVPEAAERRLCSVLFVDLVGFTSLGEKVDPEDVRELLSSYFARAGSIIFNYGGTVEKFIGDAVVAVWGAPTANEDDAERAVRAGLDVVAAVPALGREIRHDDLRARAGIVTGEIAITVGRVSEGMLAGDAVNSASRLQSLAEPETVLVAEATWRASSQAIAYEAAGELVLKGKSEPFPAWRALRVVGQRKGLGRSERLEPPFVGRDAELQTVKDLLHATDREQRARLVSITGVPGIGKSRLAWEFLKYVDGLAETIYWHQGRSATYGSGLTFGALGEMVRMRAGIDETEDAGTAREKLHAAVEEYVNDTEEGRWIEPRLAHLLGLADAPSGDREELFSAWRGFFESIAARGTTVLVFEDLQWADAGLMDFIEALLEWSRAHPIMVITLARPELRESRPEWGSSQPSFTSLHLEPLSDDAMTELLRGFVRGLPDEIVAQVRDRAEGVPLYAVETVRMLVDRGLLVAEGSGYTAESELKVLEVPETLHALVASRLDGLPNDERRLLQDAAVLGTSFHPTSLAAVQGVDRTTLDPLLRNLVRKEFLRLDSDPRSPERGQYQFVQAVVAEVALSMLSRRDRSDRHLAVARYFESMEDDELTSVVAAQYASANRAAPDAPDADEVARSAMTWLHRAGDRAASLGSPEHALEYYEQAIALSPVGRPQYELLEAAGEAALQSAQPARAISLLESATAGYRELGDRNGVGRASARLANVICNERRYRDGLAVAEDAYIELGDSGDPAVRLRLANVIASSYGYGIDLHKALEWAEVALEIAEHLDESEQFSLAIYSRANALFSLGRHQESVMLIQGGVTFAERAGLLREQARALLSVSLSTLADDPAASARTLASAAELAQRVGARMLQYTILLNLGEISVYCGQWDSAWKQLDIPVVEPGLAYWLDLNRAMLRALAGDVEFARSWLSARPEPDPADGDFAQRAASEMQARAIVALALGDLERAVADGRQSIKYDPKGINVHTAINVAGRAALWLRDLEEARAAVGAGLQVRGRWVDAALTSLRSGIAALEGRTSEAARGYADARSAFHALECDMDAALTTLDEVVLLGTAPEEEVAAARRAFTQLHAAPFLNRLNEAVNLDAEPLSPA